MKMKNIYCDYQGVITVTEDFECDYCDECDFCTDSSYADEEEEEEE